MQVYGSSLGLGTQTYEVIYSKPISAGETISFDLVYFDPLRRTTDSIQPIITAEALLEPEPDSLPVTGTLVPLISAVRVPQATGAVPGMECGAERCACSGVFR